MALAQRTEAQVSQLNAVATKLQAQSKALEKRIDSISSVQTTQLQRVDAATTMFEQALEEMRNQGAEMLDHLAQQFADRRHDVERVHAEQLKRLQVGTAKIDETIGRVQQVSNDGLVTFQRTLLETEERQRQAQLQAQQRFQEELNTILNAAARAFEEHHKVLVEANSSVRETTSKLIESTTTEFADQAARLQGELRSELENISADLRRQLQHSLALWKDTKGTEHAVKEVVASTRGTLEELKREILSEVRRPWWRKRKGG